MRPVLAGMNDRASPTHLEGGTVSAQLSIEGNMLNDDNTQESAVTDAESAGTPRGLRAAIRRRLTQRRGLGLVGTLAVTTAAMLLVTATVLAVHGLVFQLDGDTSTTDIAPITGVTRTVDWDSIFTNTGAAVSTLPANFKTTSAHPSGTRP